MTADMNAVMNARPVTILLSALGGEGGGVLADWLVDTARHCGHAVQGTSIPGVAQRTGATTYYVEIFPLPDSALGERKPVFGLYAVPGGLDLLVGSELMEATRQCALGLVSPDRTAVVVSTGRSYTTIERMQQADGRVPEGKLVEVLRSNARELELLDMAALAQQSNTVVSAVMFGALAGWCLASGLLPFERAAYEATIRAGGKGVEPSLRGFAAAWDRIVNAKSQRDQLMTMAREVSADLAAKARAQLPVLPAPVAARMPAALHEIAALGFDRLLDYQDADYAELYVQRLERLLAVGRVGGDAAIAHAGSSTEALAAVNEAARWLALWMAFDDIVRVAELKGRASRFERVRAEVKAAPGELLRIRDHFKPGVPEFAAMLPASWAQALQRWDARRVARGELPFALPLALPSHSVRGAIALRVLGGFKRLRRWGSRYGVEQALIARWLVAVERGLDEDSALGLQIARAGRLIKGYGSTNERGKHHLLHIVDQLAFAPAVGDAAARGRAVDAALTAALADDAGKKLDATLVAHGAAPRPLVAQPIGFYARGKRPLPAP
jgi:indolepyruvate ferredoxin oxidoreductase beta subunit